MPRNISVIGRKPNLVDLTLPIRQGVKEYQFFVADNFDSSFFKFATIPVTGKISSTVSNVGFVGNAFRGLTRFLFNPSDYSDEVVLQTTISLVNALRADYEAHRVLVGGGVHGVADGINTITAPAASNLASLLLLVNDIATQYEAHRILTLPALNAHTVADALNALTATIPATTASEATALALDIQTQYNAHRILTLPTLNTHGVADAINNTSVLLTVKTFDDTKIFFLRIKQIQNDGTVGPFEAMHVVLPYSSTPNRGFSLVGSVPQAANLSSSLEIQLPMQCNEWGIVNTNNIIPLVLSFEPGMNEVVISPKSTFEYRRVYTKITQLFIRGDGGDADLSAMFTVFNNINK